MQRLYARTQRTNNLKANSLIITSLAAAITVLLAFQKPRWQNDPAGAVLTYDVFGYYAYLPGAFIYHDLGKVAWLENIMEKHGPFGAPDNFTPAPKTGNRIIKYASGQALMYLPFFAVAHGLAKPLGFEADGFTKPYQMAIAFGGLFAAVLGLFLTRRVLRRFFSENITSAAILALAFGTNWHHYARFDYGHTHIWLFAVYAGLLWTTIRFWENPTLARGLLIGLLVGLAGLTRPTDLVAVLLPIFWGLRSPIFGQNGSLAGRLTFFKNHWKWLLAAGLTTAAIGSIQLIYWKLAAGQWVFYSYGEQGFSWLRPHLYLGIFSAKKGWLVYTPLMVFALAGFWFLKKTRPQIFWATLVFAAVNLWLVFAWDIWWYGGSFGQRAMVQIYAVLVLPLAAFLENSAKWLKTRTLGSYSKAFFAHAAILFCIFLNLFQDYQSELTGMGLDAEGNSPAFYRRMFLRFKPDLNDLKLQDSKDDYGNLPRENLKTLFETNFEEETDSTFVGIKHCASGTKAAFSDGSREFVQLASVKPPDSYRDAEAEWLRCSARFFTEEREWTAWLGSALVLEAKDAAGKTLRSAYHKPYRYLEEWRWKDLFFDLNLTRIKNSVDHVDIYLWQPNRRSKTLWVDDFRVESFSGN